MNSFQIAPHMMSEAMKFALLPEKHRRAILSKLSDDEIRKMPYDWNWWARPAQLPPIGHWRYWIVLAGRGFGKTRTGAEWTRMLIESGNYNRGAIIAPTAADARDVCVEGESGILAISPPWNKPLYEPSKRRLTWPNGAICTLYSADEPDRLRGPQHDFAWCDEFATWRYFETWDMLMFGLRLGNDPKVCITTTPKPVKQLVELLDDKEHTVKTGGSTHENKSNLAKAFIEQVINKYEGSRLGQQEIYAEILKLEGALFNVDHIKRVTSDGIPPLRRVVVAVDPATTTNDTSDETGICVAGKGIDGKYYVKMIKGIKASPAEWASEVVRLYGIHYADKIIAENNNGGQMVEYTIRTVAPDVPVKTIHATRGKTKRAEPIAALYEQGKVYHQGHFTDAEQQMATFRNLPNEKNDQVDALVWALTELSEGEFTIYSPPRVGGYRSNLVNYRMI